MITVKKPVALLQQIYVNFMCLFSTHAQKKKTLIILFIILLLAMMVQLVRG